MEEEHLTQPLRLGCAACAALISVAAGWLVYSWVGISHDKSINSRLQMLWLDPEGVPLGQVQSANNRWMKQAFVADASREDGKAVAVLILDDHYRGGDPTYRSASGVIGDRITKSVLCSIPSQARARNVPLDPAVRRLIRTGCG